MNTYAWRPPADHRTQGLWIRDCGHFRKTPVVAPVPVIHIVLTKRITASGNDKRHGFSRLTVVYMLYYMLHACATYVMPLLFSLSTRRLRISCSIFWRQFITFSWSIRCLTSWSCCQEKMHLAKQYRNNMTINIIRKLKLVCLLIPHLCMHQGKYKPSQK